MENSFSVEEVFTIIKKELKDEINISNYYCSYKWSRTHSLLNAYKYQGDVNHITGDANHLALVLKGGKTVLTLHDMRHYEKDLSGIKKLLFGLAKLRIPFKKVQKITTISGFMKQQLLAEFSLDPDKVQVIHNPAPSDFVFNEMKFDAESPRILQIGSSPHKNLSRLIKAIEGEEFQLILVRSKDPAIEQLLNQKGIPHEWHEKIPREEVYECYCNCDIVFFASEFEGFGVPILEANAVGRPVITSNRTSMPEVAGDGALLVDPFSVKDIREALLELKNDKKLRQQLIEKGLENVKRFTPEKIASQYLDLYKEVYNKVN